MSSRRIKKDLKIRIPVKTELDAKPVLMTGKSGRVVSYIPYCGSGEADYIVEYQPDPAQDFYEIEADEAFFQCLSEADEKVVPTCEETTFGIHYHPDTGWINDPNGLFYLNGNWHLFCQYNPFSAKWRNMHWYHAVSKDLIHWENKGITLYPDAGGTMYSGSAVVDRNNDSGLGTAPDVPPVLLFYTQCSPSDQGRQCLAYSTDGGETFVKYDKNPLIGNLFGGCERDPNIQYDPDFKIWRMVLYIGNEESREFALFRSRNLLDWHLCCRYNLGEKARECPGLIRLFDEKRKKWCWIFTDANGYFRIGHFTQKDEIVFDSTPERIFPEENDAYAGQAYQNTPDGKVVYISWMISKIMGKKQSCCMSLPMEFQLWDGHLKVFPAAVPNALEERNFCEMKFSNDVPVELDFETENEIAVLELSGFHIEFDNGRRLLKINDSEMPYPDPVKKAAGRIYVDSSVVEFFDNSGLMSFHLACRNEADLHSEPQMCGFEHLHCRILERIFE